MKVPPPEPQPVRALQPLFAVPRLAVPGDCPDNEIARSARQALALARGLPARAITVRVGEGRGRLAGTVALPHQRRIAWAAVNDLRGVTDVNETLGLSDTAAPEPAGAEFVAAPTFF